MGKLKSTAIIIMLLASFSTQAGNYEEVDFKLQTCESQGERAGLVYFYKDNVEKQKEIAKSCEGIWLEPLCLESQIYAIKTALSEDMAYRHAWAYCMDNYENALLISRKKEERIVKKKY